MPASGARAVKARPAQSTGALGGVAGLVSAGAEEAPAGAAMEVMGLDVGLPDALSARKASLASEGL